MFHEKETGNSQEDPAAREPATLEEAKREVAEALKEMNERMQMLEDRNVFHYRNNFLTFKILVKCCIQNTCLKIMSLFTVFAILGPFY